MSALFIRLHETTENELCWQLHVSRCIAVSDEEDCTVLHVAHHCCRFVDSIRKFVENCGDYSINMVDNLLNILTHGEHSKTLQFLDQARTELATFEVHMFPVTDRPCVYLRLVLGGQKARNAPNSRREHRDVSAGE